MPHGNDTMKTYMQDIGVYPRICKDEEVDLAAEIANGSEAARQNLIQSNLRLVVKIAHDFKGLGVPLMDLISEGNIGLMRAADKFDPCKGAKFSSYAAWWIKQAMRLALANQSRTVRIPVQTAGKMNKIKCARNRLLMELDREPTDAEIAKRVNLTERNVNSMRNLEMRWISLQAPIKPGEGGSFEDFIADHNEKQPDETIDEADTMLRLEKLLNELEDRESTVLKMRFGLDGEPPKSLCEVSQLLGRTRERVRQIQNQALTKLKHLMREDGREIDARILQPENTERR
ncbi:MAG: sigma-70 family RNA polymerase sigma factor [Verrucomicrobiota bacterium]